MAAVALGASLAAGTSFALEAPGRPAATVSPEPAPTILAPEDGSLLVDGKRVAQMLGGCDDSGCYHVPPSRPTEIIAEAGAESLPLVAGRSVQFTATATPVLDDEQTGAADADAAGDAGPVLTKLRVNDGSLTISVLEPGTYQVTVHAAPDGGMWQFGLTIAG